MPITKYKIQDFRVRERVTHYSFGVPSSFNVQQKVFRLPRTDRRQVEQRRLAIYINFHHERRYTSAKTSLQGMHTTVQLTRPRLHIVVQGSFSTKNGPVIAKTFRGFHVLSQEAPTYPSWFTWLSSSFCRRVCTTIRSVSHSLLKDLSPPLSQSNTAYSTPALAPTSLAPRIGTPSSQECCLSRSRLSLLINSHPSHRQQRQQLQRLLSGPTCSLSLYFTSNASFVSVAEFE